MDPIKLYFRSILDRFTFLHEHQKQQLMYEFIQLFDSSSNMNTGDPNVLITRLSNKPLDPVANAEPDSNTGAESQTTTTALETEGAPRTIHESV